MPILNKQILKIMDANDAAQKDLVKCQKTKCKPEFTATQLLKKMHFAEVLKLMDDLKNNKLTYAELITKTNDMKQKIVESVETTKLSQCSLEKCKAKVLKVFSAFAMTMEYDCKIEKKKEACQKLKKYMETLNKKPFTMKDYVKIVKLMTGAAKKA